MASPEPLGIRCPKCNCPDVRTTHTRRLPGNRVKRYKQCRHCGRRMATLERHTGDVLRDEREGPRKSP